MNVPPRSATGLAGLLDSPEITALVAELDVTSWTGRLRLPNPRNGRHGARQVALRNPDAGVGASMGARSPSSKGDLVLDPFIGSGTTALAAMALGRRCVGFDISESYVQLATQRIKAAGVALAASPLWDIASQESRIPAAINRCGAREPADVPEGMRLADPELLLPATLKACSTTGAADESTQAR